MTFQAATVTPKEGSITTRGQSITWLGVRARVAARARARVRLRARVRVGVRGRVLHLEPIERVVVLSGRGRLALLAHLLGLRLRARAGVRVGVGARLRVRVG